MRRGNLEKTERVLHDTDKFEVTNEALEETLPALVILISKLGETLEARDFERVAIIIQSEINLLHNDTDGIKKFLWQLTAAAMIAVCDKAAQTIAHSDTNKNLNPQIVAHYKQVFSKLLANLEELTSNPKLNHTSKSSKGWIKAPLPKFYDLDWAKLLVNKGYYSSLKEAHIQITSEQESKIRADVDKYIKNHRPTSVWHKAPLPR